MDEELSTLILNNQNIVDKNNYLKKSENLFLSSKLLNYNVPTGICPKAELEDDCKSKIH